MLAFIYRMNLKILFFGGLLFAATNVHAQKVYSEIWGKNGEKWDKSRIPDFTGAGYMQGEREIPLFAKQVNVKDFGAAGDGQKDDITAFRNALKSCGYKSTLYIPEGNYYLSDSLMIMKSGISLKGAGQGKTILVFRKGLEELYPDFGKQYKTQTKWSWKGAMITFYGNISVAGISDLTIRFPDSLYAGHNWHERGYNGVGFSDGANNGWVKNVILTNCDLGIWIDRTSHHITADNWILNFGPRRGSKRLSGHHGVNIYGGHNLLQNFQIHGRFEHDLSIESEYSVFNVFRQGKGSDLCIDHHNHAQRNNLFTNLDAGEGKRLYYSGGISTPRGVSFNETYWNIRADNYMSYCNQKDSPETQSANNTAVGIRTQAPSVLEDGKGNWFETIDPEKLYPADLYDAQMKLRKHANRKKDVRAAMLKAFKWQVEHPVAINVKESWARAVLYIGAMRAYRYTKDKHYLKAANKYAAGLHYQPGGRFRHADDLAQGQVFVSLYQAEKQEYMLAPIKSRIDSLMSDPKPGREDWWWCDALFMEPPLLVLLGEATGDKRYFNYLNEMWWDNNAFLYDPDEGFFYRDKTFFNKRTSNGKKVFWSRGNGWVMGGLVQVLEHLPKSDPAYKRYENLFKEMAARIASLQQPDGLWRASLLDPADVPVKETSGSAFYTFALAWGINQGYLEEAKYLPLVVRGWNALTKALEPEGKLTWVQPIGARPENVKQDDNQEYGTGAFLMAGTEMLKLIGINQ